MSADNGIYIGHFDDGYRVIHAQAIENIYESAANLRDYFGSAVAWPTLDKAYAFAQHLDNELQQDCENEGFPYILEYGIQILELGKWPTRETKHGK